MDDLEITPWEGVITNGARHTGATPLRMDTGVGRLAATVERLRRQVQQADATAAGRALIELATGILVERLQCGPAHAARQLDALAAGAGLSRLELAADIVNQASRDHLAEAARDFVAQTSGAGGSEGAAADPVVTVRLRTSESGVLAADDTQQVAASLLRHALTPLGAVAVAVWAAGSDGSLSLAGHAGFGEAEARRWRYVPPGVATLARTALTERGVIWYPTLAESSAPTIGRGDPTGGGRIVLPAGTGGRLLGVLEICWPDALEQQPAPVLRQLEALAELCAHTLDDHQPADGEATASRLDELVDGLLEPAMVLRPHFDLDGQVVDFRVQHANGHFTDIAGRPRSTLIGSLLLETYPLAARDGGLFEKIEHVHATGEPLRADRMRLTTLVDQVAVTAIADISISRHGGEILFTWRLHDEATLFADLLQHALRLGRIGGFEEAASGEITWNAQLFTLFGLPPTAQPISLRRLSDHAHADDAIAIERFLRTLLHHRRPASTTFRLRRSDGTARHMRVVAEPVLDADELIAVRGAYQDVSAQHWTEVALAATRDQLSHTERQAAEHNRMALQLQHAIMPPSQAPIDTAGLRIAVRYRPAEEDHLVGGDWYDAVTLPSQQVLLAVGDIAGHGIQAATGMVVLRNALRGLAATGAGPAQLLSWLNTVTYHLTDHVTATAVCALYDPGSGVLRWARAGHLPPVLIRADQASTLPDTRGVLLGATDEFDYEEGRISLRPGDTLLMYTDGLIERRDRSLQHSQRQLLAIAETPQPSLDERLDHLLTYSSADTDDDTCVIGVQLT